MNKELYNTKQKTIFLKRFPQNNKVTEMRYDVLKNTPILWKNNRDIGINELMERRLEIQQWVQIYPNGLNGIDNELKSVNRFVISELKKQLDDRGLVMVDVELMGIKDWRGSHWSEVEDNFKRFVCFIPKVVCGSKEDITFFLCTLFRELNVKLTEDYKSYEYVQYIDWLKDVKIELKNPLQSEVLEPLFGTNKFIWIYPNQMKTMKDFSSIRYCDLYDRWSDTDVEYMKTISERDKYLCDTYGDWKKLVTKYNCNKTDYHNREMDNWLKNEMNIGFEEVE